MKAWQLMLGLGLPVIISCGDKEIEETETTDTNDTTDTDTTDTGDTTEEIVPLEPAAIGFEFSGLWIENGNEGEGALAPYLFPDLSNQNGGLPFALSYGVTVTLASVEYFGLGSSATDEERAYETCTVFADFAYSPANLLAQDFNWSTGVGSAGTTVELWQSFEGTLVFRMDSASERCAELAEGHSLETFDNMRFGIGFGPLSDHMRGEFESTDWWADDTDAQASYFTQYIAVNHPNSEVSTGYDFIAYDWNSAIFVNADVESCVDLETGEVVTYDPESTTQVCGEVMTEEVDGSTNYDLGDTNADVGSRVGYVQGNAWWYEDYPNLDLSLMGEYPE